MSNRELPMMPWFPDQFAASTAGWTFTERAVYRALLDLQWQQGCIFADQLRISQALGVDKRTVQRCWRLVGPKFAAVEGGLQNFRLEQHRLAALELHKKKVAGGLSRQAQLRAVLKDSSSTPARTPTSTPDRTAPASISISKNKKTLHSGSASARKHAANGQGAAACPSTDETGAIREDNPEIQRKRREAETLAAQHAKPKDDDMPF